MLHVVNKIIWESSEIKSGSATGTQQQNSGVYKKEELVCHNSHYYGEAYVRDVKVVIGSSVNITDIDM